MVDLWCGIVMLQASLSGLHLNAIIAIKNRLVKRRSPNPQAAFRENSAEYLWLGYCATGGFQIEFVYLVDQYDQCDQARRVCGGLPRKKRMCPWNR